MQFNRFRVISCLPVLEQNQDLQVNLVVVGFINMGATVELIGWLKWTCNGIKLMLIVSEARISLLFPFPLLCNLDESDCLFLLLIAGRNM